MKPRKLIQHGTSSLTVALPKPWLDAKGLQKGDAIFVSEEGDALILTAQTRKRSERATIKADDLDRTSLLLNCQSLYRYGYDEIEVIFTKATARHYRTGKDIPITTIVHTAVNRMIGAEVIEQSNNRLLIKYLALESTEDFRAVLRRIFLLIQDALHLYSEGIQKHDATIIASLEDQHDTINKFVSYALRLLNKYGYSDVRQTCFYFHIIASLDKIVDILKYSARASPQTVIPTKAHTIVTHVEESMRLYAELFYHYSNQTVRKLGENRDETKQLLASALPKLEPAAALHLAQLQQIQELLLDLTDFRFALEQ